MKEYRNLFDRFTVAADLPSEPLPGLPIVELAGDSRIIIENHRGITEYGRCRISVKVNFGCVCICGEGLELARMAKEQLVITGRIDNIAVFRGRK